MSPLIRSADDSKYDVIEDDKRARGMELIALSLLADCAAPVGSPRLVTAFRAASIDVAEATAGRYLRSMDERGLTIRVGRQGRRITERGRERLQRVQLIDRLDMQSNELVRILSDRNSAELADILNLRRVVEGEAARLAALRANAAEQQQLCEITDSHADHVASDQEGRQVALDFHLAVAIASHSPLVRATVELLIEPGNNSSMQVLDALTLDAGAQHAFAHEHRQVAAAIRRRDAQAAESAMRAHLDALRALLDAVLVDPPETR
jgi:DNA-binding FadR family transcriptional regulator